MQSSQNILIADDDEFAQTAVSMMVKAHLKIQPLLFSDGKSLVDEYRNRNGAGIIMILMDINMPGMNGFQATKEIRSYENSKGLTLSKIYGLSGDDDAKTIEACKQVGMDGLLGKPLKKDKLLSLM